MILRIKWLLINVSSCMANFANLRANNTNKGFFFLKSNFIKLKKVHISSTFYTRLSLVAIILKDLNKFPTP